MAAEKTTVSDEMVEAARASVRKTNENRKSADSGVGVRRRKAGGRSSDVEISEVPLPDDFDLDDYGPSGFAASFDGIDITGQVDDQEFIIDAAKIAGLPFTRPGQNLPKKRLYTVKALHRDGRLVQLGFESQIQNNAGGDPLDAIGLRRYQRKGIKLLYDFETMIPVYCAAWGCFAKAHADGFCSERHAKHTLPNMYKDAGQIVGRLMEAGVTTSTTWSV